MSKRAADTLDNPLTQWLACYLDSVEKQTKLSIREFKSSFEQYHYTLPSATLRLLKTTLYVTCDSDSATQTASIAAIKSALIWQKSLKKLDDTAVFDMVVINIQGLEDSLSLPLHFGARYFMEKLIVDTDNTPMLLQVFSARDWQNILAALQNPADLGRWLGYHRQQLTDSLAEGTPTFETEQDLFEQFMHSEHLFKQAITIDNALITAGLQDKPNSALVAMSLAQRNKIATAKTYAQHREQAAILWTQLTEQMVDMPVLNQVAAPLTILAIKEQQSTIWQQQLLDESLFSRHELIRTLYNHPKQPLAMQESGYVIHQHSYERLGRHYLLIFYGNENDKSNSKHNRAAIEPNLSKIAQDVATRLPLAELHHVVVLGIMFVQEEGETYIDIDTWIQPVAAMSQKERQLTKQLQRLKQQTSSDKNPKVAKDKLPTISMNMKIPARLRES